jgi:hypothetical protein
MNFYKINLKFLPLFLFIVFNLFGCDQIKSKLADISGKPSPLEVAKRIDKLVQDKAYQKAISEGEAYLQKNQDPDGVVSESIIKAYMAAGDTAGMIEHINKYKVRTSGDSVDKLPQSSEAKKSSSDADPPLSEVRAGGASVTQTKQGTVVKAGDVIVVMPK